MIKSDRIIGTLILLMKEKYQQYNRFTPEGILFTEQEIVSQANKVFPENKTVKGYDVRNLVVGIGSAAVDKYLVNGDVYAMSEYYRLCSPGEAGFYDVNEIILKIPDRLTPNGYSGKDDIHNFVEEYFSFIKSESLLPRAQSGSLQSREAVWIAAATLTYNEYVRMKSTNLLNYTFQIRTIDNLAQKLITAPPSSGFNALIGTTCTKDSNRPINPFLIATTGNKRRIAQSEEVASTKPDNLPMDFIVNTISGTVSVRTLVEFINSQYAAFSASSVESLVEVTAPQVDYCEDMYGKEDFLQEVYMLDEDYDKLIGLLRRKQNIILQGAPGTGKTFAAKRLAYAFMGEQDDNRVTTVQFHQGYSYEDFIEGYRPKENGYALEKGVFYKFCKTASENEEREFFFIIDEINRGNLSKIFGELFTLLESSKRGEKIKLVYSGEEFAIPANVYVIGLMNTADRSLAMIDYALRRRFGFFTMKPGFDTDGFKKYRQSCNCRQFPILIEQIKKLNENIAKDDSLGEGFCIGHSFFCALDEENTLIELKSIVDNEIIPLLEEYWFDEPQKVSEWRERLERAVL